LHIGSGSTTLPGWLCTDICPSNNKVTYLDATKKFPLPNNSFQYIYSEHMIEHITHIQGLSMLKECYRVIKPGGRIRIATPDLKQILLLYTGQPKGFNSQYIKWSMDTFAKDERDTFGYESSIVFNYFFHKWGHQFIYDEQTLTALLIKAGFKEPKRVAIHCSEDPNLANIERHQDAVNSETMIEFETMIVEAVK